MLKRTLRNLIAGLAATLCLGTAHAVTAANQPKNKETAKEEVGSLSVDLLRGNGTGIGYALRYGGVVQGSEVVTLDGRRLKSGADYFLDNASGVISFGVVVRTHQTVRVSYRHSPKLASQQSSYSLPLMALNFGGGSVNALYNVSPVQRFADGRVMQGSSMGLASSLKLGQSGGLQSLLFFSSQKRANVVADPSSTDRRDVRGGEEGNGQFIVQNLDFSGPGGLKFSANYQDISSRFTGFGAMANQQGLNAQQVGQWQKEKGLKRLGFSLGFDQGNGSNIMSSFNQIADGANRIDSMGLAMNSGALGFYYKTRSISRNFNRFNDLSENERGQWAKERGLTRRNLGGSLKFSSGLLKFDQQEISENTNGLQRQLLSYESATLRFSRIDQKIDASFNRFNDLAENERGQWAKERGLHRTGFNLAFVSPFSKAAKDRPWNSFAHLKLSGENGSFERQAINLAGDNWLVEVSNRNTDPRFNRLGDLADDEKAEMIREVKRQFNPGDQGVDGKDVGHLPREQGLSREMIRLQYRPGGNTISYSSLNIKGADDALNRTRFSFDSKDLKFNLLDQNIGAGFTRLGDLIEIERNHFANEVGMQRRNWDTAFKLGAMLFNMANVNVGDRQSAMSKQSYRVSGPLFDIAFNQRDLSSGFRRAGDLADPERDLLRQLTGFKQHDLTGRFKINKNLSVDLFQFRANNNLAQLGRSHDKLFINWTPNARTKFVHNSDRLNAGGVDSLMLRDVRDISTFDHDFGKLGKVSMLQEFVEKRGSNSQNQFAQKTDQWKYEGAPIDKMAFNIESKRMSADDGRFENLMAYQVRSTQFNRTTLQLTHASIDRQDGAPDEEHRGAALDYKLAQGSTLSYAWTQRELSTGNDVKTQAFQLTQSTFGNLQAAAKYEEHSVENGHTKALSEVGLQTVKPINLGLVKQVQFSFGYQALADKAVWKHENKQGKIEGFVGKTKLGFAYAGVITPSGDRAIDRTLSLQTDPDPKKKFHAELNYKTRTLPDGMVQVIRKYRVDWEINKEWKLEHDLETMPERAQNNVPLGTSALPQSKVNWALEGKINEKMNLVASYKTELDGVNRKTVRKGGLALKGETDSHKWLVGYSVDGDGRSTGHTYSFAWEPLSAESTTLLLIFDITQYDTPVPSDKSRTNLRGRLDWRTYF